MGGFAKGISKVITFGLGGKLLDDAMKKDKTPQAQQTAQTTVETAPAVNKIEEVKATTKKKRVNLFETQGGITGQELNPSDITPRKTLLGN